MAKDETWEYVFHEEFNFGKSDEPGTRLLEKFNKLGQQGWEIVDDTPAFQSSLKAQYLFKRKKK